ncbi:MAG: phytoene desaturase [Flammeovirgaceae bacterium]|jgi:phytoene desaturase|nr:phytoene desaturase [Flammeovirgaceae bacterium]|tara:strand:- start:16359 stop:17831 length:1473 start_codon:yes stop_codon:yes gene_type:complete
MNKRVIIIGTGISGLAASLRMRRKGYEVIAFESNDYAGGKITDFQKNGYRWDMGPSLFTLPSYIDELFELFEAAPRKYFNYHLKKNICNYFWEDGTRFSAAASQEVFIKEASALFNEDAKTIKKYLDRSKLKYDLTAPLFLEKSLHRKETYFSLATFKAFVNSYRLHLFHSLNTLNRSVFKSEKLVQIFNRFATYNGSTPYKTPAIMSLIPHLEMGLGTYFPQGGIHEISQSLYRLAQAQGVQFHFNESVEQILHSNQQTTGIITNIGQYPSDIVICNMDVFAAYDKLLPNLKKPIKTLQQERSSSALIFYWGIKKIFPELDLHNILFSQDYEKEFEHIFDKKSISSDPTIYINISSKEEGSDAPQGCENWFVMINAPGNYGQDWETLKKEVRQRIVKKINRILKVNIEEYIEAEEILEPMTIESRTYSHKGSLYGASSNSQFAAFLRHPNFSKQLKNLYFCGGSVHPGGGIPLCLLSAKIVSNLIPVNK